MSQAKKPIRQNQNTTRKKQPLPKAKQVASSLFDKLNKWSSERTGGILIISFVSVILFTLLLFQARMDVGGDDSQYILRGYDLIHKGSFPTFQGPLYPMVLGVFIAIMGIKILFLKFLSLFFVAFSIFFFYKAFKDRVAPIVYLTVLFITAINASILSFASLTYSEAFFMFIQSLMIFYFFKLIDKLKISENATLKEVYPDFLLAALFVFLLSIARTIGLLALPGLLLYFIVRKEFRNGFYFLCSFATFYLIFDLIKKTVVHTSAKWGSELTELFIRNQYDYSSGTLTVPEMGARFIANCNLFISNRIFQILGLRSSDSLSTSGFVTFLFFLLCVFALYRSFKSKNYYVVATVLYLGGIIAAAMFALPIADQQTRNIMVYVPLLLLIIFYAIYDSLKNVSWAAQSIYVYLILILIIAGSINVLGRAKKNLTVLNKNFHGDMLYGFTPDWINYISMSKWCADNLPKDAMVATRKSEISFLYTEKEIWFPVYRTPSTDADTVLAFFKKYKINYVMLASLRGNPTIADGSIITTLWRMMQPVAQKYPQKLKLIHQEGTAEPAYLYQIIN